MRSQRILAEVATKHGLQVSDMLKRDKSAVLVAARREAIVSMKRADIATHIIAKTMDLDASTVIYHSKPDRAQRKKDRWARKYQEERAAKAPGSFRVKIRPQYLPKLTQLAALTDASIEAAVNQAVSDMLESA